MEISDTALLDEIRNSKQGKDAAAAIAKRRADARQAAVATIAAIDARLAAQLPPWPNSVRPSLTASGN